MQRRAALLDARWRFCDIRFEEGGCLVSARLRPLLRSLLQQTMADGPAKHINEELGCIGAAMCWPVCHWSGWATPLFFSLCWFPTVYIMERLRTLWSANAWVCSCLSRFEFVDALWPTTSATKWVPMWHKRQTAPRQSMAVQDLLDLPLWRAVHSWLRARLLPGSATSSCNNALWKRESHPFGSLRHMISCEKCSAWIRTAPVASS